MVIAVGGGLLGACGTAKKNPPATSTTISHHVVLTDCKAALLGVTASFGGTAAGVGYYRVLATNHAGVSCTLDGFATLRFFAPTAGGGAGSLTPVAMTVQHAGTSPKTLTIKAGAVGEFVLSYSDEPVNGTGCSTIASVEVTLPHQSSSIPVAISFSPCGGVITEQPFAYPGTQNP